MPLSKRCFFKCMYKPVSGSLRFARMNLKGANDALKQLCGWLLAVGMASED